VNLCRDRHRRLVVRRRASLAETPSEPRRDAPDAPEAAAVARVMVRRALELLPPRRRAVVALHELDGVPVAAVARLLGVTQVTVRWHLAAARKQLAAALLGGPKSGRETP
jgi:RNA polymerase sigma-70 factor (ECF subfamily)